MFVFRVAGRRKQYLRNVAEGSHLVSMLFDFDDWKEECCPLQFLYVNIQGFLTERVDIMNHSTRTICLFNALRQKDKTQNDRSN